MKQTVWSFKTAQFTVALEIVPEEIGPADAIESEDGRWAWYAQAALNGDVDWFCAIVTVYHNGHAIGSDSLGACAYSDVREFYESHRDRNPMNRNCSLMRAENGQNVSICHYFPDMIRQAIADARKTLNVKTRNAA